MTKPRLSVLLFMVLGAAATRLIPHPPNMTSITALALFGGCYFADRRLAYIAPLTALLVSDLVLGIYYRWSSMAYQPYMWVQYFSFALIVTLGFALRRNRTGLRIAAASLLAAVLFYLVTNFGVWALQDFYPKTPAGLLACYVAAIPFFGNALIGDALYTVALFGGFRLLEQRFVSLREIDLRRSAFHFAKTRLG